MSTVLKVKLIDKFYESLDNIAANSNISIPDLVVLSLHQVLAFSQLTGSEISVCKTTLKGTEEVSIVLPKILEQLAMVLCIERNLDIEDLVNVSVILFIEHYAHLTTTLTRMQTRNVNVNIRYRNA